MKATRWLVPLAAAAALLFSGMAVASADETAEQEDPEARKGIVGTVLSYDHPELTIEARGSEFDSPLVVIIPDGADIALLGSDLDPVEALIGGAEVAVLAVLGDDSWTALQVVVKASAPVHGALTGAVAAVDLDAGLVTIVLADGSTHEIELDVDVAPPESGELVTVFTKGRGPAHAPGQLKKATGLVRAEQVQQRLTGFLAELEAAGGDAEGTQDDEDTDRRGDAVVRMAGLLENHASHQVTVLSGLVARINSGQMPEAARFGLENALANAERRADGSKEKANNARGRSEAAKASQGRPDFAGPPGRAGGGEEPDDPNGNGDTEGGNGGDGDNGTDDENGNGDDEGGE